MSQCSANRVQPMPTIATRSLIPCEAMSALPSGIPSRGAGGPDWPGLPEVVVDAVGREQAAEGHLDPATDLDLPLVHVSQLDRQPSAAVEVHHRENHRRAG